MNGNKKVRRKDLGKESIWKLLGEMAIPAAVAMIVNGLYNVVDTMFVGQGVGSFAIGGLNIIFPVQMFSVAIGGLIGMGGASIVSRSLGHNDIEKANYTAGNAFIVSIILGIVFITLISIFMEPLLRFLGAVENNYQYAYDYLYFIRFGLVFIFMTIAGTSLIRAEGHSKTAMIIMASGTISNIILDPIFIFALDMGIQGAALATVLSRGLSTVLLILYFFSGRSQLTIGLHNLKLKTNIIKEKFALGGATFFRQMTVSFLVIIMNNSLSYYGSDIHQSVYGIIIKLVGFLLMPMFGIVQGFQPIAGFNYGAGKPERVRKAIKYSIISTIVVATTMFLGLMIFSESVLRIFTDDTRLIEEGILPLRIVIIFFPVVGIHLIGAAFFQSIGKAIPSIFLSLCRHILFLIPLVTILPLFFDLMGLWISFPIADFLATIAALIGIKIELGKPNMRVAENPAA